MRGIKIIGLGKACGERAVSNEELAKTVDTSDAWIRKKTGIRSRYFAESLRNCDMAAIAAENALKSCGLGPKDIEMIIVCTFTADKYAPSTACHVAEILGAGGNVICTDINGGCTGFVQGCLMAYGCAKATGIKKALVIGSEKISSHLDMNDRAVCVLFGDGAGAAVLDFESGGDFSYYGGCEPNTSVLGCERNSSINMSGQEVYKFAVSRLPECIKGVMNNAKLRPEEVDWFVCHQANERIIDAAAARLPGFKERFYKNLYSYGNTSAASIPIALSDMKDEGLLNGPKRLICTGFGAGLCYGAMSIECDLRGNKNEN